jgi:cyclically-permuted mutarotase family protein
MNKYLIPFFIFIMLIQTEVFSQKNSNISIQWENIAILKNSDGSNSLGFAGAINALDGQALLIAGGANFPDKMPWEGGKKYYSDEIHILQKFESNYEWNGKFNAKLPFPIAYCGNTSTPRGIVYAGGENDNGLSKKAFLINFFSLSNQIDINELPDLPHALTNIFLSSIGNMVYAIGGDGPVYSSKEFLSLDLDNLQAGWIKLADLPIALANSTVVVQNGQKGQNIYVIGGRSKDPSGISKLNNTLLIYNLQSKSWAYGAPISDGKNSVNFSAGTATALSKHFLLISGGDNGVTFNKIETYLSQIAQAKTPEEKEALIAKKNDLVINHKGFDRRLLVYDTLANTWFQIGELPFPAHVTSTATKWGENIILSSGEIKPGIRTPQIMLGRPIIKK